MNVPEKAEKALEHLKNIEGTTRIHELQSTAGTLGRCLGALGSRPNYARHYANLLHSAVPVLLSLASHESAEVRLVGDEALNRTVVGGFAYHAYKINLILQKHIDHTKSARWIRAALSRVCLGETWLRPGVGKIRIQAQTLFPILAQILRHTNEVKLLVETLETHLPRILNCLAEYTTDDEILDLTKSLLSHIESSDPVIRRCIGQCVSHLCSHRENIFTYILEKCFEKLWPHTDNSETVLGWFGVIKSLFQFNTVSKLSESNLMNVQDYLELYHVSVYYIEQSSTEHNIQNCVLECLSVLLSQATGAYKKALLERHPKNVCLDLRVQKHSRNISSQSVITSILSTRTQSIEEMSTADASELSFVGGLHLGHLSNCATPRMSVEDLTLQTPDSPTSEMEIDIMDTEQLSKDLSQKLEEIESPTNKDYDQVDEGVVESYKVNIGSLSDDDIPLKYCVRLLASKFLLNGNKGEVISDRCVRVSVKSSALSCLSEILNLYPQVITMYLDRDEDMKTHNVSGSSETESNQDNINDFVLERNICYQDSLTDSLCQELFNKSNESPQTISKKDLKSLEKSLDSDLKSSKDIHSTIFDSKTGTKELLNSGISDTNMSISNYTSTSNEPSVYPLSSSVDMLSSMDLDIKFDHFGDHFDEVKVKKPLRRTDEVVNDMCIEKKKEFFYQHLSDIFVLLSCHSDPQIRGMVRICIGNYLYAALDLSHGNYYKWKSFLGLQKEVIAVMNVEFLVDVILKGLSDDIHSCVNSTLLALTKTCEALSRSSHYSFMKNILNSLIALENNNYWLCKVNLCKLYENFPYERYFMLNQDAGRSKIIIETLHRLLSDQDHKVRTAASNTLVSITPKLHQLRNKTPAKILLQMAADQTKSLKFEIDTPALSLVRDMHFYQSLHGSFKMEGKPGWKDGLRTMISDLMMRLMEASCKNYTQGLLETLESLTNTYPPWQHKSAYSNQGIFEYCIDTLDICNNTIQVKTHLLHMCNVLYPVEIHNAISKFKSNIFETETTEKWQHFNNTKLAKLSEKYQLIVMRLLNIVTHLIEEISPVAQISKVIPGSPVRRSNTETSNRRNSTETAEDKGTRKRSQISVGNPRANLMGNFYGEPFYMKLYENLRSVYSNHKINLDPKSSIFYEFLTKILDALAIQLELSTEKEYGHITEEILYYLKTILPSNGDRSVYCVAQLLKCLFGTNLVNQYKDYESIKTDTESITKESFFDQVLLFNKLNISDSDDKRDSVSSNSQKLSLNSKNPKMIGERQLLIKIENFLKNKMDRKWSTNKKELERYIRLFEPVVIQALKNYTMQNDIPLQCQVLGLLRQLLTLRVNYCMLDSEQVFIGFLMKQMELLEQREIPNCLELVSNIMLFLVQLSASKHHSKQIIELPKLIQLCDGLLASGSEMECITSLRHVSIRAFSSKAVGVGGVGAAGAVGAGGIGRAQQQEAAAAREVLFSIVGKTLQRGEAINLVSCILALSQDQPENYYRWSQLASDTLLCLLSKRTIDICDKHSIAEMERVLDYIYKDVLLEQSRVEIVLKILFQVPPDQTTSTPKQKLCYLVIIMVLLRKVLVQIPESEILLSINYLKMAHISPQSIFFNVKNDVDPLNVQNVNEDCASLPPDVVLVRFLFKTLTYAILEIENCQEIECANLDSYDGGNKSHRLLYSVCINLICIVKDILHLADDCPFPLSSKTAQSVLHNEQSGLNTGLYSPDENIPLELLNLICLRSAYRIPLLTVHWSHLLIRLKFLEQKYWQKLLGFVRNLPLSGDCGDRMQMQVDLLQIGCFMAYCEYFLENGLSEVIHLTWLLVNRIHILIRYYNEDVVKSLVAKVNDMSSASGLLLQAVAARSQNSLKDEFALNTHKILSACHESQSGPLIFLVCKVLGKLEPSLAMRFAKLGIERCKSLHQLPAEEITSQLSKEDVQVALEMLQKDKAHLRYPSLVIELNALASAVFDLSPLDLSQDRSINPQYVLTTKVDGNWLLGIVKNRCSQTAVSNTPFEKTEEIAQLLTKLNSEELSVVTSCSEFERKLLKPCFKIACDIYLKEFLDIISVSEAKEFERDNLRRESDYIKMKEEMLTSSDSNKLVANSLQVFRKNDNSEAKSQFFISITDNTTKFGNLQIDDEEVEIVPPKLPDVYLTAVTLFDKYLTDVIRLFPKQSRPLSQSENFNLNIEHTVDLYTKRCHQVFQEKLFYKEFYCLQTILSGFLQSLENFVTFFDDVDCDLYEKCQESIIPLGLAKNISTFSVISLQYLSFLIKNKKVVESPVNNEVSFRLPNVANEKIVIDNVINVTLGNVSKAFSFNEIWSELNSDKNENRIQSAVSCLYGVIKYFVKDTKPLILQHHIKYEGPESDIVITCEKLLTLISYWEHNFYGQKLKANNYIIGDSRRKHLEDLLVSLSRLELFHNISLIPPMAWPAVDVNIKDGQFGKVDLPLQAFEDMDVLEAFLFRVNLISWSSKKQFEEIWVALLAALQGNGTHWAVRGMTQLLLSCVTPVRKGSVFVPLHVPRGIHYLDSGIQRLRTLLVGTTAYNSQFDNINLERIPLINDRGQYDYHYGQFNTEFLKYAAGMSEDASYKVKQQLKRLKKRDIDINSCVQLLLDVATQMLEPKSPTGLASRASLLTCITICSDVFTSTSQWGSLVQRLVDTADVSHLAGNSATLLHGLAVCMAQLGHCRKRSELSTVHQKLIKSLSSSFAPLRHAALHGCLLQLYNKPCLIQTQQSIPNPLQELITQLNVAISHYLIANNRISLYEQSLYWAVLFALVELGHPDLITIAVDFIIQNPKHYCTQLVVKGITTVLRQQVLPKELKNATIEKLMDNMKKLDEKYAVQIVMVHLFTADTKLLNPKLSGDSSNMDPDVLMNSMERLTQLYSLLRDCRRNDTKIIVTAALKYFIRETLPPAAILSRAVIEFLESCKMTEKAQYGVFSDRERWMINSLKNAEAVFEVFETAISQDQLPVVSGWIFEALCHLLSGKISNKLLPYCLITLLVSASSNNFIRKLSPLTCQILRLGFQNGRDNGGFCNEFAEEKEIDFYNLRLLCVIALHSNFNDSQLVRLKELCMSTECMDGLLLCLNAKLKS